MILFLETVDLKALCLSRTPPYGGDSYSEFIGNQWNEDWRYIDGIFDTMTDSELFEFYMERRDDI